MRTLEHARRKARELRTRIGHNPVGLVDRLERYIEDTFHLEILAVASATMAESLGEITPSGLLRYDERLTPAEKLEMLAHELGHIELHERLTDYRVPPDPILGSAYADGGAGAVARYSPRMFEEAQASAFATEFLCPSDEVMRRWRSDPSATSASIATIYGVPIAVVRAQLAQALHGLAVGPVEEQARADAGVAIPYDESQLRAARFVGAPLLVDAGPGTGKTATLVRRIRFAIEEHAAHPRQILVLTFSDEAASELHARIAREFGEDVADQMTIATFHGFGMTFLHHHGRDVGLGTSFRVLDEDAQAELVNRLLGSVPCEQLLTLSDPSITVSAIVKHIGHCKDRLRDCEALAAELGVWTPGSDEEIETHAKAEQFLGLFQAYESEKLATQGVDFADLILLPIRVLSSRPDVAAAYREKFPWVMVDEFQDVSRATSKLLAQLCGPDNPPWVVGDARQAIYRFRGADPENVSKFEEDFPGAVRLELELNYRSSAPVIRAANELATLMQAPDATLDMVRERWRPGREILPLDQSPIRIATASSDAAERLTIASQVHDWLITGGVHAGDIAILARRNVDVREIVLALGSVGIRAAASGLLTPEGAAGDLAAVVTAVDASRSSVPRLVYALGRGRFDTAHLNAAVRSLLYGDDGSDGNLPASVVDPTSAAVVGELVDEVRNVINRLAGEAAIADGFAFLAAFLFDASAYLRRVLDAPASAERSMALVEIVSSLVLAVGDRIAHPASLPSADLRDIVGASSKAPSARVRRLAFAERFRGRLTATTPVPVAPPPVRDAVRVMTCHASKGLEFPCVIVAGQTLPAQETSYPWLPPSWHPAKQEDLEQADALLFVGVTRAQRALVVSHPTSAGGGPHGRSKESVPLLGLWEPWRTTDCIVWDGPPPVKSGVRMGPIWGGRKPERFRPRALDGKTCTITTYLQDFIGLTFPTSERALYPAFVDMTRRAMRTVLERAHSSGRAVSEKEVDAMIDDVWSTGDFADHPHLDLYRTIARRMTRSLALQYATPVPGAEVLNPVPTLLNADGETGVRLDLIGHIRYPNDCVEALSFRPESLAVGKNGSVNWSELSTAARLSFVVLAVDNPAIAPRVFSGRDGALLDFAWSRQKKSLPEEQAKIIAQRNAFSSGVFETTVSPFICNMCAHRIACPEWLGAIGSTDE